MASSTASGFGSSLAMLYCDTHLRNQLIVSNLKINSFEIRDAIGFDNDWLTGLRLFYECCSRTDYKRLPQLLEQAEKHNQLVAAIEPDIQNAANLALSKSSIVELNDVITTFSQTKRKILDAIATYNILRDDPQHNSIENHMGVAPAALIDEPPSQGYRHLIQKSLQLAIHL
ncbi:hypothetical protein IQ260_27775 [Leptolyngbya cf. ectocarpi LEGE 11479]|uniref:Uncharacterized protein n=1 Tax=Leptolyngbya cf. ectocarpi LEGE 11479 TaxID=1828722 RepID=A0A929FDB8_LEPEC|nr:hypothetical protein [Leptolyngbya ectocarpi]MBE9070448.1 hypothetical protein [Leptolyngbya cf. ectocarpi LEGE 11479]